MKTIIISLLAALAVASCGLSNKKDKIGVHNVTAKLLFETHTPYCGGARPTPKMAQGSRSPISNQHYYFELEGHEKIKASTDENGKLSIDLQKGDYLIYSSDKVELSYTEFYNKFKSKSKFEIEKEEQCFKDWYAGADFKLNIQSDTVAVFTVKKRCYVGNNKCINYEGPIAP